MKLQLVAVSFLLVSLLPRGKPEDAAVQQPEPRTAAPSRMAAAAVQVNVDYGAQLLLTDAQGRETGYEPATGKLLHQIPGAAYIDDSVSDETDDSDDPATAEARVLRVPSGKYLLKVLPAGRQSYRIQFSCRESKTVNISADNISILPGEQHSFSVVAANGCPGSLVRGAFPSQPAPSPLLTYAFPASSTIHLLKGAPFRIIIVYASDLLPGSFSVTLNGQPVTNAFHPRPDTIESVSVPVAAGQNILLLNAFSSHSGSSAPASLSFTIDAD